jgi:hypothetical protein
VVHCELVCRATIIGLTVVYAAMKPQASSDFTTANPAVELKGIIRGRKPGVVLRCSDALSNIC